MNQANKLNRRRAFRIYEQVDLYFQKIDKDQEIDIASYSKRPIEDKAQTQVAGNIDSSSDPLILESHSQVNDSLNVNISISGISFTCKEKLKPGDYLMIKVFLLSSMTLITSFAKVVYLKATNPFEKNQYPYLVGAHFIDLNQQDKASLNRHINKKRTRYFIFNGLMAGLVLAILAMPDMAFDLLINLGSFLLDNLIIIVHLSYEFIEYSIDHFVETVFHTDLHDTQIISFYIQAVLSFTVLYGILRVIPSVYNSILKFSRVFYHRKKSSFFYYWGEQAISSKIKIIGIGMVVFICYVLFYV